MNTTEVLSLLEANKNDRGIENWEKLGANTGDLKSFSCGYPAGSRLLRVNAQESRASPDHEW